MRRYQSYALTLVGLFGMVVMSCLAAVPSAFGQTFGLADHNPWDENSRTPFQVEMSGFLNTKPEEGNIEVVTLGINSFREEYQFEIIEISAPNYAQMSTRMILQKVGRRGIDFNLIGPRALLSKVAQAPPGSPLKITGMYEQRKQRFQLTEVKVIGME